MKGLALHGFAFKLARRMAARRPGTLLLAVGMVMVMLAPAVFAVLVALGARQSLPIDKLAPEVVVFVARGAASSEIATLRERVRAVAGVTEVTWIPRDTAWAEMAKRTALPPSDLKANPLPDVLIARLEFGATVAELEQASAAIGKLAKVDTVQSDWGWYRRLERGLGAARVVAAAALAVAGGMCLVVLVAAARLLAHAVPEDLRVLALLGAEPVFVRQPFALIGGAVIGLGALLAAGAAFGAARALDPFLQHLVQGYGLAWHPVSPDPAWAVVGWLTALLLGLICGGFGLGRAVR